MSYLDGDILESLIKRDTKIAIIGLGYVGLPLALAFSKQLSVIGFDINENRIKGLQQGLDVNKEFGKDDFIHSDIIFTNDTKFLETASCFIIVVPTAIGEEGMPDLLPLKNATKIVGEVIKKGDFVIYESTVYPGCTEEDCVPILEISSGLRAKYDFKYAYSPERINPGDTQNTLTNVVKVVAGCDDETANKVSDLYRIIIRAGTYIAPSIKVAEASKIVENTQRDINIALMNEFSMIFDKLKINTREVLAAASTKWNFQRYYPGLVGGHCIGVDSHYMSYKAASVGYDCRIISASRKINNLMGEYVAKKVIQHVKKLSAFPKVLVKGITFKENVSDIRNSKITDTIGILIENGIAVEVEDPFANEHEVRLQYGINLIKEPIGQYDAIIVTVAHSGYLNLNEAEIEKNLKKGAMIADLKGIFNDKFNEAYTYWAL